MTEVWGGLSGLNYSVEYQGVSPEGDPELYIGVSLSLQLNTIVCMCSVGLPEVKQRTNIPQKILTKEV
jgi:hypothetical protein